MEYLNIGCSIVKDNATGKYNRNMILDVLRLYRNLELNHVEFSHVFDMTLEDAISIGRYAKQIGLVPWSVHARGLQGDTNDIQMRINHDAQMAHALDARVIVVHPPEPLRDNSVDYDKLLLAADTANQFGLELAIETGIPLSSSMYSYIDLIHIVDKINLPYVGINIDTGHSYMREDHDLGKIIRAVGHRLKTLHAHDNFGEHDDHHMPGLGRINWRVVLKELKNIEYNGPLMMEMTDASKNERTVKQLADIPIEQEIICASSWLRWLWHNLD